MSQDNALSQDQVMGITAMVEQMTRQETYRLAANVLRRLQDDNSDNDDVYDVLGIAVRVFEKSANEIEFTGKPDFQGG